MFQPGHHERNHCTLVKHGQRGQCGDRSVTDTRLHVLEQGGDRGSGRLQRHCTALAREAGDGGDRRAAHGGLRVPQTPEDGGHGDRAPQAHSLLPELHCSTPGLGTCHAWTPHRRCNYPLRRILTCSAAPGHCDECENCCTTETGILKASSHSLQRFQVDGFNDRSQGTQDGLLGTHEDIPWGAHAEKALQQSSDEVDAEEYAVRARCRSQC
mmetsp:Transcript_45527/g.142780  ORF Transcript_45527/g.142780 Transcript_45527/m.142780 type:complete len:212 (+) Transcript_45527:267-902(+)